MRKVTLAAILAAILAGCGGGKTTNPTPIPIAPVYGLKLLPVIDEHAGHDFPATPTPSPEPVMATLPTTVSAIASGVRTAGPNRTTAGTEQWRTLAESIFHRDVSYLLAVMQCESGGNAYALNINPRTGDHSVGLMQINIRGELLVPRAAKLREFGYPAYDLASTEAILMDPTANLLMAHWISGGGASFGAWSCR